ncbi:M20/M25/M40 family metallo-hydrolase [Anaerolineales bacterium HSG25]|nr:M20/M25/M40 family metallo-hydrolase [Anaerolineales bacterium HSG25]
MKETIKLLTEAYGPSGYEQTVREIIKNQVESYADTVEVDPLGNLHVLKKGTGDGLKIMIAAHMDEIGLMVSFIDKHGFGRLTGLGTLFPQSLVGNRAIFTDGTVAVINAEKWPFPERIDHSFRNLYLDFGVLRKEDVPVHVGDVAAFQRPFVDLGETLLAKSLDDRIGCAVMIETLKQLKTTPHEIYFVFTVQEEVGTRGAITSAYKVQPDVAIAIDVTDSGDVPEHKQHFEVKMGQGPAIKVMDIGMLAHPNLREWMVETAIANDIPYQLEILRLGSTDARAMQVAGAGSMAGGISIPCRHLHTPSEMVNYQDVQQTVQLLLALLSNPVVLG